VAAVALAVVSMYL